MDNGSSLFVNRYSLIVNRCLGGCNWALAEEGEMENS
jgi:hypothetical protein